MKRALSKWLAQAALIVVALGFAGLLGALSGVIPITASSGHWAPTAAFLDLAKRRSVSTHTLGAEAPALDRPWLILQGAGHYETGCRPCHGSPEFQRPVIAGAMTPSPPYLGPRIPSWQPEELFYIVKHGIKFTGMPAWPAPGRDDEVRSLVAFLRELPRLDAEEYRRLVHGSHAEPSSRAPLQDLHEPAPPAVLNSCARCHGRTGQGRGNAAFPKLAGQRFEYLLRSLDSYAAGQRASGIMQPVVAALSASERRELAEYYARFSPSGPEPSGLDAAGLERGKRIAASGIREQGVPSCVDCHGPGPERRNPAYPTLAGQHADYLAAQLDLFKTQTRSGSRYSHIMHNVASRLRPAQVREVAGYYASLPP